MITYGELAAYAVAPLTHDRADRNKPGRVAKRICATKKVYRSAGAARDRATELAHHGGGRRMHPYRCPVCHRWHLTTIGRNL